MRSARSPPRNRNSDTTAAKRAFGGWFADQACTKLWSFDSDTVEKSMTLYAKWQ